MPSTPTRILLAVPDALLSERVRRALSQVNCQLVELKAEEDFLGTIAQGEFALVIASAQLGRDSSLQTLARVRQAGHSTPFFVLGAAHGASFRVFVSDGEGVVLSSRVVDSENLGRLAEGYVAPSRARSH